MIYLKIIAFKELTHEKYVNSPTNGCHRNRFLESCSTIIFLLLQNHSSVSDLKLTAVLLDISGLLLLLFGGGFSTSKSIPSGFKSR